MFRNLLLISILFVFHIAQAQCPSSVGASFQNNTSFPLAGCDTKTGVFQNTSTIQLTDVASFEWDYGNDITAAGTEDSTALWASTSYTYTKNGGFNVKLTISSKSGCTDSFSISNAVANVVLEPEITSSRDFLENNKVCFNVNNLQNVPVSNFLWNFGNPPAGPQNTNRITLSPCFNFPLGPNLVTLRIQAGPCDVTVTDTVIIEGPAATIEVPSNRIDFAEKFQCGTSDSIHFTNSSLFYNNDSNADDDDSTILVKGKKRFVFNYIPPQGGSGMGQGDQTPVSPVNINRAMGSQVVRTWNFGDQYAPQCTTSTAKGLNIGVNCNYSEDEFPVHKYQSWDSVYYNSYFLTNHIFTETVYNEILNQCSIESIDTSDRVRHRSIYDATVPSKYNATLELIDTIKLLASSDNVLIDFRKPDASKMTKSGGVPCPFTGNPAFVQQFDLNTDGQSYFAVNFDTLFNPITQNTSWWAYNSGGVLAPPTPGSPIPFVLPYSIAGTAGDEFVKGYSPGEIGTKGFRTPEGSISMGVIVGNGPATSTQPATCLDTAYYTDILRIKPIDPSFEILSPTGSRKEICAGGDAYFKLNEEAQDDIKNLRLNFGYPGNGIGEGPGINFYFEDFNYLQPYTGPKSGRNDAGITYNGQDWLYNSVTRINVYGINGQNGLVIVQDTLETIVTAIIKDWKTELELDNTIGLDLFNNLWGYNNIPEKDLYKLLGNGTNGCLDTTGIGYFFTIKNLEYKANNGDDVIIRGSKRYRYTDATKTDSIEVAHVLHFRDSSLQGYDTLIVGTDTTFGVWKHSYTYKDSSDGQLKILNASGLMNPNVTITNLDYCDSRASKLLNVGYHNVASVDAPVYKGEAVTLLDNIRYWQYGDENFLTYPFADTNYWNDPSRVAAGLETFKVDWDISNGITDWTTGINRSLNNTYTQPGTYTITMASKDRLNCRDTFSFDIAVLERPSITVDFVDSVLNPWDCNAQVLLSDLSFVSDDNCSTAPCDSVIAWNWTFSNGESSSLQNPTIATINKEDQTIGVKLVATTANGLSDSVKRNITVFAGNKPSQPDFSYSVNDKTLSTEVISVDPQSNYAWEWGDGATSSGSSSGNTYINSGLYNVTLTQTDTASQCISDSTKSVNIGGCNALFGYQKDTASNFAILLLDSSTGSSLSYLWNWGDGNTSTGSSPSHDYTTSGLYLVTLTVSNTNCSSTFSDSLGMDTSGNLLKKDGFRVQVGTAGISKLNKIEAKVYPNPTNGNLTAEVASGQIQKIELYTLDGKEVNTTINKASSQKWLLQFSGASGRYILITTTTKGSSKQIVEMN